MSDDTRSRLSVMLVCMGNICRSPTAHGVLRQRLADAGLAERVRLASSGTGHWHVGKPPDPRAREAAEARGYDLGDLRARQITEDDLDEYDYVIAMDEANYDDLISLAGQAADRRERIHLFGDFSPAYRGQPVGDPYYGGTDGFERVLDMIEACADGLIETLRRRLKSA